MANIGRAFARCMRVAEKEMAYNTWLLNPHIMRSGGPFIAVRGVVRPRKPENERKHQHEPSGSKQQAAAVEEEETEYSTLSSEFSECKEEQYELRKPTRRKRMVTKPANMSKDQYNLYRRCYKPSEPPEQAAAVKKEKAAYREPLSTELSESEEEQYEKSPPNRRNRVMPKPANVRKQHYKPSEQAAAVKEEEETYFKHGAPLSTDSFESEEEQDEVNPPNRRDRLRQIDYVRLIKKHLIAKRLDDALNVLEERMLKKDRVKPDKFIYNLLISACAKAGQTSKAFSLYTKMRQRGLPASGGTYTSLFNACAHCTNKEYALQQMTQLRESMLEKNVQPNLKHYNAMIKAYGRCDKVRKAFHLVDEMMERELPLETSTFNFLLQACASEEKYGFRHALLTWHKMLEVRLKPDLYSFKTMLRCTRDCGIGDLEEMQKLLENLLKKKAKLSLSGGESSEKQLVTPQSTNPFHEPQLVVQSSGGEQLEVPNLLQSKPHLGSLVALTEIDKPHERFLLLGGINGFLDLMKGYNLTPDIQLFTAMLDVVAPTYAAEKQLISWIRRIGLKADIDFFNVLIKKRSMRFDYEGAKEVLSMARTAGLHPNIVTYGVLALGCRTVEEARDLHQEMQANGVRLNMEILGAMLRQGCAKKSFSYINEIIQLALDERVPPNDMFLQHLHKFYNTCARAIDARHPGTKKPHFKKGHAKFCDKLRAYYYEYGMEDLRLEDKIRKINKEIFLKPKHEIEGEEPLKNEELARKQKERKYIKKINLQQLRDGPSTSTGLPPN